MRCGLLVTERWRCVVEQIYPTAQWWRCDNPRYLDIKIEKTYDEDAFGYYGESYGKTKHTITVDGETVGLVHSRDDDAACARMKQATERDPAEWVEIHAYEPPKRGHWVEKVGTVG